MSLIRIITSSIVVASALVTLATADAAAATNTATQPHTSWTFLKLTRAVGNENSTVTLTCDPAEGSHPHPIEACDELAQAHGDPALLPGRDPQQICPFIVQQVAVSAIGEWHGRQVIFRAVYSNTCFLENRTGDFFDF